MIWYRQDLATSFYLDARASHALHRTTYSMSSTLGGIVRSPERCGNDGPMLPHPFALTFYSQNNQNEEGLVFTPILQMRRLRPRAITYNFLR